MTMPWVISPSLVTMAAVPAMAKKVEPLLIHPRALGVGVCYQKGGDGIWHWGEVMGLAVKSNNHHTAQIPGNGDQLIWSLTFVTQLAQLSIIRKLRADVALLGHRVGSQRLEIPRKELLFGLGQESSVVNYNSGDNIKSQS